MRSGTHALAISVFAVLIAMAAPLYAQDPTVEVDQWLTLEPVAMPMPAFHEDENIRGERFEIGDLVEMNTLDHRTWWPAEGATVSWDRQRDLTWSTETGTTLSFDSASEQHPEMAWAATYIESDRWTRARLTLESHHPVRLFVNGQAVTSKATTEDGDEDPGEASDTLELERGKHLLLVQAVKDPSTEATWSLEARLDVELPEDEVPLRVSTEPERFVGMAHLTDAPSVSSVATAPNGDLTAITITQRHPPDGRSESRIELRATDDGTHVRTYSGGMDVGAIQWAPEGRRFSYLEQRDEQTDLWLVDLDEGTQERLLEGVEDFSSYTWSPEGSFIIYSLTEEPDEDGDVRRLEHLEDRRPWFRQRQFLYRLNVPQGTTQRLTAGNLTTNLNSISPEGDRLVYSRSHINYEQRPFTETEFAILDLETMEIDSLFTTPFAGSAQWSPDGAYLLISGGPSMLDGLGANVPDDMVANDYDTQAYLYELETGDIRSITYDFDPSVSQLHWGEGDDVIYLVTTDRSYVSLYRYDVNDDHFEQIATEADVIHQFSVAQHAPVATYTASGASAPPKAWLLDLTDGASTSLADPAETAYEPVRFGDIRDWSFMTNEGVEIDGHIYYPPDFDESREYPVIVYYYGGTTPVDRSYAGRYPKELWAAKGYLVYVLQPSGAIGYGQEFSALHVNDWGGIVADEIIDGTEQFLEAHPYADRERVGAIGASFGGFMTMLLMTRTDMFAAAVSHAGISNITSYWGEGFWGFQYSGIATAESYPWNRPDIYVERSPIYHADRITTPLLLVTGNVDTNVPPGESIQMFTALKLLGRDVAYVEVEDQDHHILEYNKYIDWANTILAWFDRWLKEEPEWWEAKY